jgi:hypothetical protein
MTRMLNAVVGSCVSANAKSMAGHFWYGRAPEQSLFGWTVFFV